MEIRVLQFNMLDLSGTQLLAFSVSLAGFTVMQLICGKFKMFQM